ncbi:Uncharacterized protein DAT39_006458, partial [Clarias magur]
MDNRQDTVQCSTIAEQMRSGMESQHVNNLSKVADMMMTNGRLVTACTSFTFQNVVTEAKILACSSLHVLYLRNRTAPRVIWYSCSGSTGDQLSLALSLPVIRLGMSSSLFKQL